MTAHDIAGFAYLFLVGVICGWFLATGAVLIFIAAIFVAIFGPGVGATIADRFDQD